MDNPGASASVGSISAGKKRMGYHRRFSLIYDQVCCQVGVVIGRRIVSDGIFVEYGSIAVPRGIISADVTTSVGGFCALAPEESTMPLKAMMTAR